MHATAVFLAAIWLLVSALLIPPPNSTYSAAASGAASQGSRPNIVFITTDDQDLAMLQYMPRVQELLVAQGVTFNNAFVVLPLCSPSHVSMMTGQYPHNHGVMINPSPLGGFVRFRELDGDSSTIGTWLQAQNYRTGRIGKYLVGYANGSTYVPPGWDDWRTFYDGYTGFTQYAMNENGIILHYGSGAENYIVDVLADKAVDFIEESDPRPFFLFFAPPAPHSDARPDGPTTPAPRHRGRYSDLNAPRSPSFNEEDVSDKLLAIPPRPLLSDNQIADLDYEFRSRAESLLAVDEAVERIVEALTAAGKLDNTYIFFTSDNGYHLGHHRLPGGKGTFFEEDIRVPLVVRGPGVAPGSTRDQLVLNIDFTPTWVELSGARPGRAMDGASLLPLLSGASPPPERWRQDFLVEIYLAPAAVPPSGEQIRAVRSADWVYAEYAASGARQLYDLRADPHQLASLHDSAPPGVIDRLSARLDELATCAGDTCRR
jgi:N-acetylglucosamine-6-sulfatase